MGYMKGGLRKKYRIEKIDGETDPDAEYFVLRTDKDPHARKALLTYAVSVREDNEEFSDDLFDMLRKYDETIIVKGRLEIDEEMLSSGPIMPAPNPFILLTMEDGTARAVRKSEVVEIERYAATTSRLWMRGGHKYKIQETVEALARRLA